MGNELVRIEKLPMAELMSISKAFAESGMFENMKSAAQAFVKIQAGQEIGVPPFAAMSGIHIIKGKPAIGAGLMASRVKGSGKYDYKVKEQTEKICSIDFLQGKDVIGNSTFTIEDARKAGTQNLEKFPKNMLFARAMSNGVKWFCPDIFSGPVYTPEEIGEGEPVTEDVPHEVVANNTTNTPTVTPSISSDDKAYRTVTNDVELITDLIDKAKDAKLLKLFCTINSKFFNSNPEMKDKLIKKGQELNPQPKQELAAA